LNGPPGAHMAASPVEGVTVRVPGIAVKLAVTDVLPVIVIVRGLVVPVAPPLQLLKVYPALGAAVRATCCPEL
jgi:hypothetical protein